MKHLRPLLTLIGSIEAPKGYDQVFGGSVIPPPKPITGMTIKELRDWQDESVRRGSKSSAAGRYQIIRKTIDSLLEARVVKPYDKFDEPTQDKMALALLKRRGLKAWERGALSDVEFAHRLSKEWASLPRQVGAFPDASYYSGDGLNKALVSRDRVLRALETVRDYKPSFWARVFGLIARLFRRNSDAL